MTSPNAVARMTHRARAAWTSISGMPNRVRLALRDFEETRLEAAALKAGPTAEERRVVLREFYGVYEELVELLCDASQYGPDGSLESRYAAMRQWMQAHYPAVRPNVVAFLAYEVADARQSIDWHGATGDAFEALFAAPTLAEFLRLDDGEMIWRIERTRHALNAYGEHLRLLAAEDKVCG